MIIKIANGYIAVKINLTTGGINGIAISPNTSLVRKKASVSAADVSVASRRKRRSTMTSAAASQWLGDFDAALARLTAWEAVSDETVLTTVSGILMWAAMPAVISQFPKCPVMKIARLPPLR